MAYSFKGNISFGFVYIPIVLSLAVSENTISFKLFDKKTKSKVKYKKTCLECKDRVLNNEDIIKGYEYESGKYVMLDDKDFEKIKLKKDHNITIDQFVELSQIDPIYYNKAYYVTPTGGEKAFFLLLKALHEEKKAGIGKTILGTKETLIIIREKDGGMILNTLFFEEEVKKIPKFDYSQKIPASELRLAKLLIKEMSAKFDSSQYHDEYNIRIMKAINSKIKGKDIVTPKEKAVQPIENLMMALKSSLDQYQGKKKKNKPSSFPSAKN